MPDKEILYAKFRGEHTSRVPWVAFAGVHAGKLVTMPADLLYQDVNALLPALLEVNKLYTPDGQPVLFDLQIEAEILGCKLKWLKNNPPSVITHPWKDIQEIPSYRFSEEMGRLPLIKESTMRLKDQVGSHTAVFGLFTGPLTLASHLRGTDLYLDLIRNPSFSKKILHECTEIAYKMIDLYSKAGADVIALVDPVVSQISPKLFQEMLSSNYSQLFDYIREKSKRYCAFFVCGDASNIVEAMCLTKPDAIFVDENINMKIAQKITDRYQIALGGNIPLTMVMLHGNQRDNMKFVIDMLENLNHDQLIIAPGCDMPYDIPIENVIGVADTILHPQSIAKSLENYFTPDLDFDIKLPDYQNLEKPLIELFTIDSDQCAACKYMKNVAVKAIEKFGDKIDFKEYKWTDRENIARTKKMEVKHLPCIYINGKLKWSSIIPQEANYFNEIEKLL